MMTLEAALLTAVVAEAGAITALFTYIRMQQLRAETREDSIHEQYRAERAVLGNQLDTDRREFTRVLYQLANIQRPETETNGTDD